jgi:DNA-binding response OmpR family regulator
MKKKILVIDDDPKIVQALQIRLKSAGYEVLTARDGVYGLRLATEGKPDLVLLDIMMPVGGGFSVAHRLREQASGIPVVFITASKQQGLREMADNLGAVGFIEKPYEPEAVLALVTEALMANAPSPVAPAQPPEAPSTLHKPAPAAALSPVSPPHTDTITRGKRV